MAANFGSSIIINLPTKAAVSVFALGMFWHNTRKTRYSDIFILPPERDTQRLGGLLRSNDTVVMWAWRLPSRWQGFQGFPHRTPDKREDSILKQVTTCFLHPSQFIAHAVDKGPLNETRNRKNMTGIKSSRLWTPTRLKQLWVLLTIYD
jgi:hypothetical protein